MYRRWVLLLLVLLYTLWLSKRERPLSDDFRILAQAPFVEDYSLTVVLPIIPSTLATLDDLLSPFLVPTNLVYEVAIICHHSLLVDTRRKLHFVLLNATHHHPKVFLYPLSGPAHFHQASLDFISQVKTQWVLLLDEHGLKQVADCHRAYLVHPRSVQVPVGPHGFVGSSHNWSQLSPSYRVQPAAFLVPPFVAPSHLLAEAPLASPVWPVLGNYIAKLTPGSLGGIIIGTEILDNATCNTRTESETTILGDDSPDARNLTHLGSLPISPNGFVALAFPCEEDLRNFVPATCKLLQQGYTILAYLYDTDHEAEFSNVISRGDCTVTYFQRSKGIPGLSDWLASLGSAPDIMIGLDHPDLVSSMLSLILEQPPFLNTTLMRLPRLDLPYTEWIGTLTIQELRNWNVPEITLSVITNDRPQSLRRLLESIQRTLFYGDKVDIRINMDQTSDPETMHVVHNFEWFYGSIFLHHRIIHGGLLPAVAESWYPHCDDSYGLLLEDDIELSPLSYAWIKMALLRYEYGSSSPSSSQLFGISLYQQKIIELRPTGRQPFDARALFRSASLADPSTPYLSQIPCSWGALYFPTPWREFHDYLSLRLSQRVLPLGSTIVPGLRSNKWAKSWKRYFIELVYLRGYVMLYPNYEDFVSLSTNHLEVGSHVKDEPGEVYELKKRLFLLELMQLEDALPVAAVSPPPSPRDVARGPRLLDLPGGTLPDWERLPVLDLVGKMSSMGKIQKRGKERRTELGVCPVDIASLPPSVQDVFCRVPV